MRVHVLGVRGSTPAPGREFVRYGGHTSCLAITRDGEDAPRLLLDAGTGVRRATDLLHGEAFRGTILLSHLHWDHVQGLPFFTAADREDSSVEVRVPEQSDGASAIEALARGMSPPHFPVRPDGLRGDWRVVTSPTGASEAEGFEVTALEVPHRGGRAVGYRVSDGRATLTYIPDHCPTDLGAGPDGWGEYHASALALAEGTDALVHDAQLVAEEIEAEAWFGHAAAEYAAGLGRASAARRVVLFHYKPSRTDDELDAIARRFTSRPDVTLATQDLVLDL